MIGQAQDQSAFAASFLALIKSRRYVTDIGSRGYSLPCRPNTANVVILAHIGDKNLAAFEDMRLHLTLTVHEQLCPMSRMITVVQNSRR